MNAWLSRNAAPIAVVLVASAVVIGIFEGLDAVTQSSALPTDAAGAQAAGDEFEGLASLAGLIKVFFFLAAGAAVTKLIRRRIRPASGA